MANYGYRINHRFWTEGPDRIIEHKKDVNAMQGQYRNKKDCKNKKNSKDRKG